MGETRREGERERTFAAGADEPERHRASRRLYRWGAHRGLAPRPSFTSGLRWERIVISIVACPISSWMALSGTPRMARAGEGVAQCVPGDGPNARPLRVPEDGLRAGVLGIADEAAVPQGEHPG